MFNKIETKNHKKTITVNRETNYEFCLDSLLKHVKQDACCKSKADDTLKVIKQKFVTDNRTELDIFSMWENAIHKVFKNNDGGNFCLGKHPSF